MGRLRQGALAGARQERPRVRAWSDPRGGRDRHRPERGPLVQGAPVHPLPDPDEVPRRDQAAVRRRARARVHDEGRLQLPPRRRVARRDLPRHVRRLHAHLRPLRARPSVRSRPRRAPSAEATRTSSWSSPTPASPRSSSASAATPRRTSGPRGRSSAPEHGEAARSRWSVSTRPMRRRSRRSRSSWASSRAGSSRPSSTRSTAGPSRSWSGATARSTRRNWRWRSAPTSSSLLHPPSSRRSPARRSGFAGPVGLEGIEMIADHTVEPLVNTVVGGNERRRAHQERQPRTRLHAGRVPRHRAHQEGRPLREVRQRARLVQRHRGQPGVQARDQVLRPA